MLVHSSDGVVAKCVVSVFFVMPSFPKDTGSWTWNANQVILLSKT